MICQENEDTKGKTYMMELRSYFQNIHNLETHTYFQNIHNLDPHNTGTMMMRVIDFEGYCRRIQVPEQAEEELIVNLNDTQCPWNEGTYRLNSKKGALTVERDNKSSEITLNPFQLSQVIGGLTLPSVLREMGIISCSPETAQKLDAIFPVDSFMSYVRF